MNHATGAGYPAGRPVDFERAKVVVPPKALLSLFHQEPSFRQITILENMCLAKARDVLAPPGKVLLRRKTTSQTLFLQGDVVCERIVRVVWCEFKSESGHWKKAHLLLRYRCQADPGTDHRRYGEPLLTRLVPGISNTGKRVAAKTLIRAVYRLLDGRKVRVLVDSWYMRRIFIESMLARGFDVIGQVRIDTRLYDEPPKRKKGQRGRPRKYGRKYTPKRIAHLKRSMVTLPLYGKEQEVRYRSKVLMAHFLGGRLVRVVWCEFKSESGHWKKAHLLLSTDAKLTPEQIIEAYGERWSIESMFNQLKLSWGLKEAWQQTRQTLHRWVHLTLVGYGLIQLLGYLDDQTVRQLCCHSPWRKDNPTTAGQIRKGLLLIFHHVPVRQWWNRKCRKFEPPNWRGSEQDAAISV